MAKHEIYECIWTRNQIIMNNVMDKLKQYLIIREYVTIASIGPKTTWSPGHQYTTNLGNENGFGTLEN